MRALTLTQPWATLVALGVKRCETRGWAAKYRGPIAIHASREIVSTAEISHEFLDAVTRVLADGWNGRPKRTYKGLDGARPDLAALPRSSVLAIAQLQAVVRTEDAASGWSAEEKLFGDWSPGRYAWVLSPAVRSLTKPVPCRGSLGLWTLEPELETAVEEAAW
jgi:hypothetical protein